MLKILIVKLSAMGDVVHCLPVAVALKQALPGAHIAWLVDKASAELLIGNKCIDEVIVFEGKRWSREAKNPANWLGLMADFVFFIKELRRKGFTVALEMQGLFKSGFLAMASGASTRVGFDGTREFAEIFLTHRIKVGDYFGHDVPVVELNLKVADALLNILGQASQPFSPSFCLPAPSEMVRAKVDGLLHTIYIRNRSKNLSPDLLRDLPGDLPGDLSGEKPLVSDVPLLPSAMPSAEVSPNLSGSFCVLIPGTTWVTKIWPEHSWYQLGAALSQKYNYKLLIVGGRSETQVNQTLCQKLNALKPGLALDLTNETSLIDLSVIFELSSLVVGGDTGPLHLAAAIGKPKVLGIYGSTPWRRNGPYGEHCRSVSLQLNCQPCYAKHCRIKTIDCLRTLTVDQVMAAINQLLENHPPIDAVSSC